MIGIKDQKWGERPLALVVRRPEAVNPASEEQVRQHLMGYADRGVISKYGVPERVLFVDALDKTSVGKLDKKVLRVKFQDAVKA